MFDVWKYLILIGFSCHAAKAQFEEEEEPKCLLLEDEICPNKNITFWLYTNTIIEGRQLWVHNLSTAEFKPRKPIKVLIHGFNGHRDSLPNTILRPLLTSQNYYVISPDFGELVKEPCYSQSVHNAKFVGRCLAPLLTQLLDERLAAEEDLHLIGSGLGAHVAGFTGNFMPNNYKLQHITGLNPAKPLFLGNDPDGKLDPSDAKFVDVVHTDVLMIGLLEAVGHVDFYVNMGVSQPNCGNKNEMSTHFCHHNRSVTYYAESIATPLGFYGYGCPSYQSFLSGSCMPSKDVELMGFYARFGARGRYFLDTNNLPPYAMGLNYQNLNRNIKGRVFVNDDVLDGFFNQTG